MAKNYKGYTILINAEQDDINGDWNGRYRIMSDESVVVYESFSGTVDSDKQAVAEAEEAACTWIDSEQGRL